MFKGFLLSTSYVVAQFGLSAISGLNLSLPLIADRNQTRRERANTDLPVPGRLKPKPLITQTLKPQNPIPKVQLLPIKPWGHGVSWIPGPLLRRVGQSYGQGQRAG